MENQKNWATTLADLIRNAEATNIQLGMEIADLKREYYYNDLIEFLKGNDEPKGHLYFDRLKPLYDKYGYEKINRVLLELEEPKAEEKAEEKGEAKDE